MEVSGVYRAVCARWRLSAGTEYTVMNKTGLFPVLVRLNLEKKVGQKKKVNKHTITNCGTCFRGNIV